MSWVADCGSRTAPGLGELLFDHSPRAGDSRLLPNATWLPTTRCTQHWRSVCSVDVGRGGATAQEFRRLETP